MESKQILADSNNISLNATTPDLQNKLCDIWPVVKEGLQLLTELIKNPVVKFTISGIIAAGDAVIGKICH